MASADRLRDSRKRRRPVRFVRPVEEDHVEGFVMGVGAKPVLVARLDGGIRYAGFEVFRSEDFRELREAPTADFLPAAGAGFLSAAIDRLPRLEPAQVEW